MKTLTTLLIYSLMLMAFTNCKSDDDNLTPLELLPPITQTGENTFGCLVNGKAKIPNNTSNMSAIYQGGGIQISGEIITNEVIESILIIVLDPFEVKQNYSLTNLPNQKANFLISSNQNRCLYDFDNTFEGSINFSKIDKTNYIISGSFEFSTKKDGCPDIKITNGRFDMKYIP
ncbi:hypothetical protein [Mariniflexile sp.]|uniref:hypothetical protein n=1 Tax=Mariniflexile sp. TaxID=1979402 RepID=UPI0040479219